MADPIGEKIDLTEPLFDRTECARNTIKTFQPHAGDLGGNIESIYSWLRSGISLKLSFVKSN